MYMYVCTVEIEKNTIFIREKCFYLECNLITFYGTHAYDCECTYICTYPCTYTIYVCTHEIYL